MRQYENFDEIERDLKLLSLQRDIDKEKILLSYNRTKESLGPKAILKGMAGGIFKSAVVYKGVSKILGMVGDRKK